MCLPSTGEFVQGNTSAVMEAVISVPPLPNLQFPVLETNSSQLFGVSVSRWRSVVDGERVESRKVWKVVTRGVSRKKQLRCLCSLPSPSQSSSQEGDAENLPIFEKFCDDGAVTAGGLMEEEWVDLELWLEINRKKRFHEWLNGFKKDPELHPIDYPAGAVKPSVGFSRSEPYMQGSEVRSPSWLVTIFTFVAAFSAGVALALCGSGFLVRKHQEAMVDVRLTETVTKLHSEQLLGHFRADEAPQADLRPVLADQSVKLRTAAANAFLRMQDAARKDGIWLTPLSGFRSIQSQQDVFFGLKAKRLQSAPERAKVSALPGYSEHHTGYAVDIGDAEHPDTYLQQEFERGAAYNWLKHNAARFHYELSFSKDNIQGVLYEPWHWRFVGDDHSLQTFYAQRKLAGLLTTCDT